MNYAMGNGDPIAPVTQQPQFIYPAHNATGVPLEVTFQLVAATNPNWDITLEWEPEPDGAPGQSGEVENLPYDTSSYGPVFLTPDTLYSVGMAINNAVETVNADGIPVVMDMDAEAHILFTTATTAPLKQYLQCLIMATTGYSSMLRAGMDNGAKPPLSSRLLDQRVVQIRG